MSKRYHAHIYLHPGQRAQVEALVGPLSPLWHDHPVGPHPLPMVTLRFNEAEREGLIRRIVPGLEGVSILIHEDSGNDLVDHTTGAEWIGAPVALDFTHFERIRDEKSFEVFPE